MTFTTSVSKCDGQIIIKLHSLTPLPYWRHCLASHAIFSLELLSCVHRLTRWGRAVRPVTLYIICLCHTLSRNWLTRIENKKRHSPLGILQKHCFWRDTGVSFFCECLFVFYPLRFGNNPAALWRGVRSTEVPLNRVITLHFFSLENSAYVCT